MLTHRRLSSATFCLKFARFFWFWFHFIFGQSLIANYFIGEPRLQDSLTGHVPCYLPDQLSADGVWWGHVKGGETQQKNLLIYSSQVLVWFLYDYPAETNLTGDERVSCFFFFFFGREGNLLQQIKPHSNWADCEVDFGRFGRLSWRVCFA